MYASSQPSLEIVFSVKDYEQYRISEKAEEITEKIRSFAEQTVSEMVGGRELAPLQFIPRGLEG